MISLADIIHVLEDVSYKDWSFFVAPMGDGFYLQVRFAALDHDLPGGGLAVQRGRKWYLSTHMTLSEVVQTAFSAVRWAEEHEMRELFTYRGQRIFGPHFDVNHLAHFASVEAADHRAPR